MSGESVSERERSHDCGDKVMGILAALARVPARVMYS